MIINVKNTPELSELPVRATPKSTAYDVFAVADPEIVGEKVGELWKRIDYIQYRTAIFAAPQKDSYGRDYHVLVHPRSSASKYNLLLANGIGLIDSDYRGEFLVRYKYVWQPEDLVMKFKSGNFTDEYPRPTGDLLGKVNVDKIYKKGDRVCQLVVEPTTEAEWVKVESLDETVRGTGGFESTGRSDILPITNREATTIKFQSSIIQKSAAAEKTYETHTDILEKWKEHGGSPEHPTNYETLIKEREKSLLPPK